MNERLTLKVKRLTPTAKLPTKAHDGDAAFDLYVDSWQVGEGLGIDVIGTGIAADIPPGWFAKIEGRSSLALHGFSILGGVIDAAYRGEWKVAIKMPPEWKRAHIRGERIAQFVLLPVPEVDVVEVEELGPSARGEGGFGSTGR